MAENKTITTIVKEAGEVSLTLRQTVQKVYALGVALKDVLSDSDFTRFLNNAAESSSLLEQSLSVLRQSMSRFKTELAQAAAPLVGVFVPYINQAIFAATQLASALGKTISTMLSGIGVSFGLGTQINKTAQAQNSLAKASTKAKKSLAGFDEINRLVDKTGSGISSVLPSEVEDTLTPQMQAIVDKINQLVEPLKKIDLTPAVEAFNRLKEAIAPISRTLFAGLEWAWYNLLVPLAEWTVENVLPLFLDLLTEALKALNTAIEALKPYAAWLWENFLKPLAQWAGGKIIESLTEMTEKFSGISTWITENEGTMANFIGLIEGMSSAWGDVGGSMGGLSQVWERVKENWTGMPGWFRGKVADPLVSGLKTMANGMIGYLNGTISGTGTGVNGLIQAFNALKFEIPSWIPFIGGKKFSLGLKTVAVPQIPYLAQGAVLPANRPFMAVVGDQKHGTNIEAPLSTIQEAVSLVMADQTAALAAGFEASIGVQREILQAVLGISVGDEVIGQAVARYNRKMAVVRGGYA